MILGEIASIGFVFVGIFPEDQVIFHIVPANISINGFSLYYCSLIVLYSKSDVEGKKLWGDLIILLLLLALYIGLIIRNYIPIFSESPFFCKALLYVSDNE